SADSFANAAVAAVPAHASRDQIAQPGQARKGLRLRAEGHTEARHFHQAARHQGREGVVAKVQADADARRQADHVFQSAGQFNADKVRIRVNAKPLRGEELLNVPG